MLASENSLQIPRRDRIPECLSLLKAKQTLSHSHSTGAPHSIWVQIPAEILSKYMTLRMSINYYNTQLLG